MFWLHKYQPPKPPEPASFEWMKNAVKREEALSESMTPEAKQIALATQAVQNADEEALMTRCYEVREEMRDSATPAIILYFFVKHELERAAKKDTPQPESESLRLELNSITQSYRKLLGEYMVMLDQRVAAVGAREELRVRYDELQECQKDFARKVNERTIERDRLKEKVKQLEEQLAQARSRQPLP